MTFFDTMDIPLFNQFTYWIEERHRIHLKRSSGANKPWTDDKWMQSSFFTNPFRENDKTTIWFRNSIRDPLYNNVEVIMATVIFRWFNFIPTGIKLIDPTLPSGPEQENDLHTVFPNFNDEQNLLLHWDSAKAIKRLTGAHKTVTGAFMVKSPNGMPKLQGLCQCIDVMWNDREAIISQLCTSGCTLEHAWEVLENYPYMGGFTSYEVVSDLRHTQILNNAPDIMTWCNLGPGGIRGFNRIFGLPFEQGLYFLDWRAMMQELLKRTADHFSQPKFADLNLPKFEMRDIEHSLCEFDKYQRLVHNEGKAKRTFDGLSNKPKKLPTTKAVPNLPRATPIT